MCYERDRHGSYLFAVINPLTKGRHDLPPIKISTGYDPYKAGGIGFDDSTNTLKTVFVFLKDSVYSQDINVLRKRLSVMVHCSGMSSWREIPQTPAHPISGEGLFCNGRLHWLANHLDQYDINSRVKIIIVWFDVKTEEFGLTDAPTPREGDRNRYNNYQLVDLYGKVGVANISNMGNGVDLWVLKHEGWRLHCSLWLRGLAVLGCWNKEGDILLTFNDGGTHMFVYRPKNGYFTLHDGDGACESQIRMYQTSLFTVQHKC